MAAIWPAYIETRVFSTTAIQIETTNRKCKPKRSSRGDKRVFCIGGQLRVHCH